MRPVAIVGPTATGKSQLGVALAEALGGEVINADAMQLYRGMDIGTAKVTAEERRGVPHHLLDVLDVTETASVAAYQRDARACVEKLLAAGRVPILVGGSGLYVRAVLDDLEFPGTDPDIRTRLEGELERVGAAALHARLTTQDPLAATAILPTNGRRVVRALEVIELTGRPFSATMPRPGPARYDTVQLGLDLDTAELDTRVDARVATMFAGGLVDEVRTLEPPRPAAGSHRLPRAGLPAGPRRARRRKEARAARTWSGRRPRPRRPPAASSAASAPGSAATPASPGSTPPAPTCSKPPAG